MLVFDGFGGLVVLGLWIFCFIDVLLTPEQNCRNLPKLAWVFIVLLLPFIGSIGWLVAGHDWEKNGRGPASTRSSSRWSDDVGARPSPRASARGARTPSNPDDDEEFLAGLRLRAEEQRRRAREQQERESRDPGSAD